MTITFRYAVFALLLVSCTHYAEAQFKNFVTASGDSLLDGDTPIRFISFNIPTLVYIEDNMRFAQPNPWRPADAFEINDALEAIHQAGGQVVRMYVPSLRKETDDTAIVRHVLGPGQFNEQAFASYDTMLAAANRIGVRVIIPFVDNWWWWGGPAEYAHFRGKKASEFWTDSLLIADFKKTVDYIVNRVNTVTGVRYKDDRAILCWETGNELDCPTSWNTMIAAYVRSLDPHHLIMAGANERSISEDYLADTNIGIVETHHYDRPDRIMDYIGENRALAKTRKPYIVGEFGFIPTPDIAAILDTVIADGINGIMIWSMRQHNRDGGFYYHQNAYRWPGFASGSAWDEIAVDSLFHVKAAAIAGKAPAPLPLPAPPRLLPIATPFKISWQGSTGATSYVIERKEEGADSSWKVIAPEATDAEARYTSLFADTLAMVGHSYDYRIRAQNPSGVSEPSPVVGPVSVAYRLLIDEMRDSSLWFAHGGDLTFMTLQDLVRAKEDMDRVRGADSSFIVYRLGGAIDTVTVKVFATTSDSALAMEIFSGPSAETMTLRESRRDFIPNFRNFYGFYCPVVFTATDFPAADRFVKITLVDHSQVARIEIAYSRQNRSLLPRGAGGRP